jgi:hypothetical protein
MMRTASTPNGLRTSALGLRPGQGRAGPVTALVTALLTACGGAPTPASKPPSAGAISPPPRSVRVERDEVVVEGGWFPVQTGARSSAPPNAVRVVCRRAARSCKEDLTRPSSYPGADPIQDVSQYRVDEWTTWGKPAGKLVASRREGATEVQIRVSLSGLAAEKVVIDKGVETRWRLE